MNAANTTFYFDWLDLHVDILVETAKYTQTICPEAARAVYLYAGGFPRSACFEVA